MKASASTSKKSRRPKDRAPATFAPTAKRNAAAPRASLILFDIDGTLVLTGGAGRRAMSLAFEDVLGIRNAFDGLPMAGRTDSWILSDAVTAHGLPVDSSTLTRFHDVYLRRLEVEI